MQIHGPSDIFEDVTVHLNDHNPSNRFVVIEFGKTDVYAYTPAECDAMIKAWIQAKSLLLGETSEPLPQPVSPASAEAAEALLRICDEAHPKLPTTCQRPAGHKGGHKNFARDDYWPRHDGGSEDLDAALTPPGYSLPASELTSDEPDERGVSEYHREEFALERGDVR